MGYSPWSHHAEHENTESKVGVSFISAKETFFFNFQYIYFSMNSHWRLKSTAVIFLDIQISNMPTQRTIKIFQFVFVYCLLMTIERIHHPNRRFLQLSSIHCDFYTLGSCFNDSTLCNFIHGSTH